MPAIDCSLSVWISFSNVASGKYYFPIKLTRYVTLGEYPLIQIGVSYLDLPTDLLHSLNNIMMGVPLAISEDDEIPYFDGSGSYIVPEDLKLDYITAPIRIDPDQYVAASVIDWAIPSYFFAIAVYIPVLNSFSTVPNSMAGYRPPQSDGLDPEGCWFMPRKNTFTQVIYEIAAQQTTFNFTTADVWGNWAYNGYIPTEEEHHIWEEYNMPFLYTQPPFVQYYPGIKGINTDNSGYNGFPLSYHTYTGKYALETLVHESPNPLIYYPGRLPEIFPPITPTGRSGVILTHITQPLINLISQWLCKDRKQGEDV